MKLFAFCLFTFAFCLCGACRPAAAPVAISNKPVSVNEVPVTNQPLPPTKPVEEMTWAEIDVKTNTEGVVSSLKNLQGKAVILDFWATNCPPCVAEIPHLKELQAKYGKENLEIVGMHVGDDEDRSKVPAFAGRLKIDYPLAVPENHRARTPSGRASGWFAVRSSASFWKSTCQRKKSATRAIKQTAAALRLPPEKF